MKIVGLHKYFFCLAIVYGNVSYSIDLFKVPFRNGQTIAVYTGAFDPPHLGHDEVMHYALSHGMDYVVVVPDSKFNRYKPFVTNVKTRRILLNSLYSSDPLIITSSLDYQNIMDYLARNSKDSTIVAVLGSDNFIRLVEDNKVPALKADSWLIMPRVQDRDNPLLKETKTFAGKPVVVADINDLKHHGYSSTSVRNTLRTNPEFYTGGFDPSTTQLPIDAATRTFIRDFKLYQSVPKEVAESKVLIGQITKAIMQLLPSQESPQAYTIINAQQEGIEGLSGNLIFFVTDSQGKKIATVKVFVTHDKNNQYDSELYAIDLLANLNLKYSEPIKKLFSLKGDSFNLIGLEYASGRSLESILKEFNTQQQNSAQRKQSLKKIETDFRLIGTALAELHASSAQKVEKVTSDDIKKFTSTIDLVMQDIELNQELMKSLDIQKVHAIKEKLIYGILQNPGYFSYLHGDSQPGNFFVDEKTNKVIMIDLAGVVKYLDSQKKAKGFPAHDYYQFLSSIDLAAVHRFNLSPEEVRDLKNSFIEGYSSYMQKSDRNISTQESLNFFKFYWDLRGVQNDLLYLKYGNKDALLYQKLRDDLQFKIYNILNLGKALTPAQDAK